MKQLALFVLLGAAFAQMPVIPLPNPLPQMGYTGATFTDPTYGTTITQCTDQNTDPTNKMHYSFEVGDSGGSGMVAWSFDGTMLRGMEAGTGSSVVFSWDGHTCTFIPGSNLPAGATFSHVSRKQYYAKLSQIWQQDLTVTPPALSMVTDLAVCLPPGIVTANTWKSQVTTMDRDEAFAIGFSDQDAQDTGEYVVVWTPKGCHVWNTVASTIDGVALNGVPSFRIHDVTMSPAGWILVSIASCPNCPAQHGPFLWLANTNVINLMTVDSGGHLANGHVTTLNLVNAPKMGSRLNPYVQNVSYLMAPIPFPAPQDVHCGWQADDPLDLSPFWCSQMSIPKTGNVPVPISVALQDEIYTVDPTSGAITRQGHCFDSGVANQFNFRSQYCIGAMDPTGYYIAFSSDLMGTLGNTVNLGPAPSLLQRLLGTFRPTPQPCTLGAAKPDECQSQIFIVTLKK